MDPSVSEEEEAEYQGYIDQYQELLDWPSSTIERSDWEVYSNAICAGTGEVENTEDEIFVAYVDCANQRETSFSYDKWITGVSRHG